MARGRQSIRKVDGKSDGPEVEYDVAIDRADSSMKLGLPMNVGTITVGAADGSFSFVVPANCYSAARKPNCFAGGLHFRYALLFTAKSGPEEGKAARYPTNSSGFRVQERYLLPELPSISMSENRMFTTSYFVGDTIQVQWRTINIKVKHTVSVSLHNKQRFQSGRYCERWTARWGQRVHHPSNIPSGRDAYQILYQSSMLLTPQMSSSAQT